MMAASASQNRPTCLGTRNSVTALSVQTPVTSTGRNELKHCYEEAEAVTLLGKLLAVTCLAVRW
jgi:hypothetical protein